MSTEAIVSTAWSCPSDANQLSGTTPALVGMGNRDHLLVSMLSHCVSLRIATSVHALHTYCGFGFAWFCFPEKFEWWSWNGTAQIPEQALNPQSWFFKCTQCTMLSCPEVCLSNKCISCYFLANIAAVVTKIRIWLSRRGRLLCYKTSSPSHVFTSLLNSSEAFSEQELSSLHPSLSLWVTGVYSLSFISVWVFQSSDLVLHLLHHHTLAAVPHSRQSFGFPLRSPQKLNVDVLWEGWFAGLGIT